jgi:hypothetical protein
MTTVEIRRFDGEDRIFIEDQLFDWGIDDQAIGQINNTTNLDQLNSIHENIRLYFLQSLESFLGRKVTIKEVYNAIKSGKFDL